MWKVQKKYGQCKKIIFGNNVYLIVAVWKKLFRKLSLSFSYSLSSTSLSLSVSDPLFGNFLNFLVLDPTLQYFQSDLDRYPSFFRNSPVWLIVHISTHSYIGINLRFATVYILQVC